MKKENILKPVLNGIKEEINMDFILCKRRGGRKCLMI